MVLFLIFFYYFSVNQPVATGALMNNGSRDTSASDIQKLQQQLQDMKEQVGFA